ncbi:hypothetical protein JW948_13360 [bacterium]|nr:hypothetical protein [bacterium]
MKNRHICLIISLIIPLFIVCGQGGNADPVGLTGGGDDGYIYTDHPEQEEETGKGETSADSLIGSWISVQDTAGPVIYLTFRDDQSYVMQIDIENYPMLHEGRYSTDGNQLILNEGIFIYQIDADMLMMTLDGYVFVFRKVTS